MAGVPWLAVNLLISATMPPVSYLNPQSPGYRVSTSLNCRVVYNGYLKSQIYGTGDLLVPLTFCAINFLLGFPWLAFRNRPLLHRKCTQRVNHAEMYKYMSGLLLTYQRLHLLH